jgi:hypothetical protein
MSDDDELDIDGAVATRPEPLAFIADFGDSYDEDEAIDDLRLDDLEHDHAPAGARVDQLEAAIQKLAAQQVASEQQRMRRKVKAATGGASLAGFIPIGLQLVDTLSVTAEVASTIAAAAGALGALLAGYLTPERPAPASPAEVLTP